MRRTPAHRAPAALVVALVLVGCGTSASRGVGASHARSVSHAPGTLHATSAWGDAVVRVGRRAITAAELSHWTAIEESLNYVFKRSGPVNRGAAPDPPSYKHCIAYLAASAPSGSRTDPAQLKRQCEQEHESVQLHILEILITYVWMREEAIAHGVRASGGEVDHVIRQEFPSKSEFARFLAITGASEADERYIVESRLLVTKLESSRPDLTNEVLARWTPRTDCRPGYVITPCRQYKPVS